MTIRSVTSSRMTDRVGFLIVGTPRSGTTLVQRLVSELRGVRVPPRDPFLSHVRARSRPSTGVPFG